MSPIAVLDQRNHVQRTNRANGRLPTTVRAQAAQSSIFVCSQRCNDTRSTYSLCQLYSRFIHRTLLWRHCFTIQRPLNSLDLRARSVRNYRTRSHVAQRQAAPLRFLPELPCPGELFVNLNMTKRRKFINSLAPRLFARPFVSLMPIVLGRRLPARFLGSDPNDAARASISRIPQTWTGSETRRRVRDPGELER